MATLKASLRLSRNTCRCPSSSPISGLGSRPLILPAVLPVGPARNIGLRSGHASTSPSSLPKVAQPSLWISMIPKSLRRREQAQLSKPSKEWNPASYFIIIFILIGSQAIRLIALQKDFNNYCSKADAKISLLREVIGRIQKGEDVDVERILGTGDEVKEREWEEVMKEMEEQDSLWHARANKRKSKGTSESAQETSPKDSSPPLDEQTHPGTEARHSKSQKLVHDFY